MNPFFIALCSFVILFGFEIRYRNMTYEISLLKTEINNAEEEILKLKVEIRSGKTVNIEDAK